MALALARSRDASGLFGEQLVGNLVLVVLLEELALFLLESSEERVAAAYLAFAGIGERR
jgi:hypothetical protein